MAYVYPHRKGWDAREGKAEYYDRTTHIWRRRPEARQLEAYRRQVVQQQARDQWRKAKQGKQEGQR